MGGVKAPTLCRLMTPLLKRAKRVKIVVIRMLALHDLRIRDGSKRRQDEKLSIVRLSSRAEHG